MIDNRIGKTGEYKPSATISGAAINRVAKTRALIDGHYCVIEAFCPVDIDAVIEELNGIIKASKRRTASKNKDVDNE